MNFSRIVRAVRTFTAPGTGTRRKGKTHRVPPKPLTPPAVPAPEDVLDMSQVADALMAGIARHGLGVFGADAPSLRPPVIRVTATLPASARELHPLARASKRLVRPEDAHNLSPVMLPRTGAPGVRVLVRPPATPAPRPVAILQVPPRPIAPPPVRAALTQAHSPGASTAVADVEDTQEIYRDAGWDALFAPRAIFSADTLDMPQIPVPQQCGHTCKHCLKLNNGIMTGERTWRCDGCTVISTY